MVSYSYARNIHYDESGRKLLFLLGKTVGRGVMEGGRVFSYGKALRVDYLDEDSNNLQVMLKLQREKGALCCLRIG